MKALMVIRRRNRSSKLLHDPETFAGRREKYLKELRKLREQGVKQY